MTLQTLGLDRAAADRLTFFEEDADQWNKHQQRTWVERSNGLVILDERAQVIVGTVAFGGEVPVFEAQPDVATTRVVLDPARFGLDGLRTTELSEALSILPRMRVLRLSSPTGLVEIALQPADAEALARRFRPSDHGRPSG